MIVRGVVNTHIFWRRMRGGVGWGAGEEKKVQRCDTERSVRCPVRRGVGGSKTITSTIITAHVRAIASLTQYT